MGLTEFFAMEAGEYLERLDGLVSGAVGPDRDEFVRLARALRGSALMANQQSIGGVAAALEGLARAVKEERIEWNEASRQHAIGAVDGLKILIRNVATWSDTETVRAKQITTELAAASGMPVQDPTPLPEPTADSGTRAFVAREGASVASVLNSTAKAVQREGALANQLDVVIKSMEPLRGLAALSDLAPLPEYLDGVERAVSAAALGVDKPNEWALFLDVAARGISKAAQEISTGGTAEPECSEAHEFTRRLAELLDLDAEVVPIESLYFEDSGPHVVEPGSPPDTSRPMQQTELVAHGEHLCQMADGLERSEFKTQLELRTISLKGTLRALTAARGNSLATAVSSLASAAIEYLSGGGGGPDDERFISLLRDAGTTMSGAMQSDEPSLLAALTNITRALQGQPELPTPAPVETVEVQEEPIEIPVVPPTPVEPEPAAARTHVPPEPIVERYDEEDLTDIAASWATYEEMHARLGDGEPSVDDLIAGAPVDVETSAQAEPEIVSIAELCYSGTGALAQAHAVRDKIRTELTASVWDATLVTDLIDELLDLVELSVGQT